MTTTSVHLRRLVALAVALAAVLALTVLAAGPASAQDRPCPPGSGNAASGPKYPVRRGNVDIGATIVTPGATITISGNAWECNTTVEVVVNNPNASVGDENRVVTQARTDEQGRFSTSVTVPDDATAGTPLTVEVAGDDATGETRTDAVQVEVVPASNGVTSADVTRSLGAGDDAVPYLPIGAAVLLVLLAGGLMARGRVTTD